MQVISFEVIRYFSVFFLDIRYSFVILTPGTSNSECEKGEEDDRKIFKIFKTPISKGREHFKTTSKRLQNLPDGQGAGMNKTNKITTQIKRLKESNYKRKVKIRVMPLKKNPNHYSIYLDMWVNNKHEYRFLERYLTGDKLRDDESVRIALAPGTRRRQNITRTTSAIPCPTGRRRAISWSIMRLMRPNSHIHPGHPASTPLRNSWQGGKRSSFSTSTPG